MRVTVGRQTDAVAEHRLQHGRQCACRCPQSHARRGMRQAGRRDHHARFGTLHSGKFFARIDAQLIDLFLPTAVLSARKLRADRKRTAGDLHVG